MRLHPTIFASILNSQFSILSMRLSLVFAILLPLSLSAMVRHVGPGQTYANLTQAVAVVVPGDTIEIHAGTYPGGLFFANLQGTATQWITIRNAPGDVVIFEGGSNAIQLSDPAYMRWQGLIFQHQTGNGFNLDDGGSYSSPAHHVVFDGCTFRDMNATGNNDLLKLSGLDSFEVRNCRFLNGAAGGSGVDMVGCHDGVFLNNYFENLGSNCIQAKGGTAWVRIEGNFFRDGGQRTLNLGGSTGLAFFRPDTAHYEAAYLQVYSNVFVGSWVPIAYVGSVHVEVVNNTFYQPENWVIRILQETVDPSRFLECGNNSFVNNIIYLDHNLGTETNIGSNTRPESFLFSHNLWFNAAVPNWSGPDIPTADPNQIVQLNPLLNDPGNDDFSIPPNSPAAGAGLAVAQPQLDFLQHGFSTPRSVGAVEANPLSGVQETGAVMELTVFPNPASRIFYVEGTWAAGTWADIDLYDLSGRKLRRLFGGMSPNGQQLSVAVDVPDGVYFLKIRMGDVVAVRLIAVVRE